jgi:hypothetical protein
LKADLVSVIEFSVQAHNPRRAYSVAKPAAARDAVSSPRPPS